MCAGKNRTDNFAAVARAVARLPLTIAWLDGEVVALDAQGRSDFPALQKGLSASRQPDLVHYVFDLHYLDGIGSAALREPAVAAKIACPVPNDPGPNPGILYALHLSASFAALFPNLDVMR